MQEASVCRVSRLFHREGKSSRLAQGDRVEAAGTKNRRDHRIGRQQRLNVELLTTVQRLRSGVSVDDGTLYEAQMEPLEQIGVVCGRTIINNDEIIVQPDDGPGSLRNIDCCGGRRPEVRAIVERSQVAVSVDKSAPVAGDRSGVARVESDRKSTRLNSSHRH